MEKLSSAADIRWEECQADNPDYDVFTDEKLWSIEEKRNTKNYRVYAKLRDMIPEQYKRAVKSLHPKTVIVWVVITGNGRT